LVFFLFLNEMERILWKSQFNVEGCWF
jgi:hypothetical protein